MSEDFPIQNESELREYVARHDLLTYTSNRRGFLEEFSKFQDGSTVIGDTHVLIFIDLDHFKDNNDMYGPVAGDEILIETANRLRSVVNVGAIGRLGADQFVALIPTVGSVTEAEELARRMRSCFVSPIPIVRATETFDVMQPASLCAIVWHSPSVALPTLLDEAERALHKAKRSGDGQCVIRTFEDDVPSKREAEERNMAEESRRVEASRRIEASADSIFQILANPQRHMDFDGSDMLRGVVLGRPISDVGDTFTMKMHRLGDDYLMINHVVEFESGRRIFWEPAPGDPSRTEGNDPSKVGIPAGYRWGFVLTPDGVNATIVTEVFDFTAVFDDLLRDDGTWINGSTSVLVSMAGSLERLEKICTE